MGTFLDPKDMPYTYMDPPGCPSLSQYGTRILQAFKGLGFRVQGAVLNASLPSACAWPVPPYAIPPRGYALVRYLCKQLKGIWG